MAALDQISKPLVTGERLSREEFLRRWELLPDVKHAELVGGVVYVASPRSIAHATEHSQVAWWLTSYTMYTPGCETGGSATWHMLDDAPQPDSYLRILPPYGGQSGRAGKYAAGAPELAVEISLSTASRDRGPKKELYRTAGVQEYITVLIEEAKVLWRRMEKGTYTDLKPDAEGMLRSVVFPGLWLDPEALLEQDGARLLEVLNQGLRSAEHEEFVRALAVSRDRNR